MRPPTGNHPAARPTPGPRLPGAPVPQDGAGQVRRIPEGQPRSASFDGTMPGTPVARLKSELGMPPEEAIAILGRLMSLF